MLLKQGDVMKQIMMVSVLLAFMVMPQLSFGAVSPMLLKYYQKKSPEVLVVKIEKVIRYRLRNHRVYVKARARILSVRHTHRKLHRGDRILIRYRTSARVSAGRYGAIPIPVVKRGHTYRAYLKRQRYYYVPTAGSRSFIPYK